MSQHLIRDEYGNEFSVDSSALAFWEHREGHAIVGPLAEPGPEPTPAEAPKTTSSKAVRPAQDKE